MILTKIHSSPSLDSFTPLEDHQSKTPSTYYDGKPVLYFHDTKARAIIAKNHLAKLPLDETDPSNIESGSLSTLDKIELFVNSENLTFFNPTNGIGFAIPYPAITLHAIKRLKDPTESSKEIQGLYMQIEIQDCHDQEEEDEDDMSYIDLTLLPSPSSDHTKPSIQTLFEAVSACSDLHPDPDSDDGGILDGVIGYDNIRFEGNVGYEGISGLNGISKEVSNSTLPPPFPGSGGWITAENVSQYLDGDGNWIGENGSDEDVMIIG